MLVVADSSPLIALINIGHIDILPQLFGTVLIPPAVGAELRDAKRHQAIRSFIEGLPPWLIERSPKTMESFPLLDDGEVAAISLALEMKADLLLIDESLGRKTAAARGIHIAGTIGIIERAADQNLLDLKDAFDRIKETDFWISHELLDVRLKLYIERKSAVKRQQEK
jgi:predicted nucleic acid-binding protein